MNARLDYVWRFCATGMAFVVFGICGVLFSVLVFPLAWLWPHRASRQRAVTTVIHWFFRALVAVLQRIGVMELEVSGGQALRAGGPAIVVANHPTYLDVMVLLSLTPRACCVVKNAHWGNPCFWGIVRSAEYVSNADPVGTRRSRRAAAGSGLHDDYFSRRHAQPRAEPAARVFTRVRAHGVEGRRADRAGADGLRSAGVHQADALVRRAGARFPDPRERARAAWRRATRRPRHFTVSRGAQRDQRHRSSHYSAPVRLWIL